MRLRYRFAAGLAVALVCASETAAQGAQIPDSWFLNATSFTAPGTSQPISRPDFLDSANWAVNPWNLAPNACLATRWSIEAHPPQFHGVWAVLEYDTKHHIALARGWGDECSLALFKAPPPSINVANADLSQYSTARGLHIGSPYSLVLAIYGPPIKRGERFVTSYSAFVPAMNVQKRHVKIDQRITLVIVDGYVSSITIYIAQSELT